MGCRRDVRMVTLSSAVFNSKTTLLGQNGIEARKNYEYDPYIQFILSRELKMRASIIIPAHNEEKYIKNTLEAAVHQSFPSYFEVIVVDNASTDNTFKVANSFENVKVVREEKKGVQFARERGRHEAKGEILAYLDADSIPHENWLKNGIAYFSQPDVVGVSGPYDYYDEKPFLRFVSFLFQKVFFRAVHFIVQDVLHKAGVMLGGNAFIKASAMEKIGGFNTSIVFYGDDTDTDRRLATVGKVLFKNDVIVKSSARRLKEMNILKVTFIYILNFIWVVVFKRPFSR